MRASLEPVMIDLDQIASHVRLDGLSADVQRRVQSLGLPGTADLFNTADPPRAEIAKRAFLQAFLMAGRDDE